MQNGWLSKAGAFTVEHAPCPHPNVPVDAVPARGVQHTTEGSSIEGALSVFLRENAPTFLVGRDAKKKIRVLQLIPLGYMAAALEHHGNPPTNGWARAQIELVGFAQHKSWLPDPQVLDALSALYGALAQAQGIPLRHIPNPQRDPKVWEKNGGWFGHDGIPGNSHWDPGQLDYESIFARASRGLTVVPLRPKPRAIVPLGRRGGFAVGRMGWFTRSLSTGPTSPPIRPASVRVFLRRARPNKYPVRTKPEGDCVSSKWKSAGPKALAAFEYISTHRRQLSAALATGAMLLEAIQKAH